MAMIAMMVVAGPCAAWCGNARQCGPCTAMRGNARQCRPCAALQAMHGNAWPCAAMWAMRGNVGHAGHSGHCRALWCIAGTHDRCPYNHRISLRYCRASRGVAGHRGHGRHRTVCSHWHALGALTIMACIVRHRCARCHRISLAFVARKAEHVGAYGPNMPNRRLTLMRMRALPRTTPLTIPWYYSRIHSYTPLKACSNAWLRC